MRGLTHLLLVLALAVPTAVSAQVVRGVLVDEHTGAPVELGSVVIVDQNRDSVGSLLSDERGFFEFSLPADGQYSLIVSGLGYWSSLVGPFSVADDEVRIVEASVAARPIPVAGVTVDAGEARLGSLVRAGFYDRLENERGEFITPDQIAASDAHFVQQLFYGTRSARVFDRQAESPLSVRELRNAMWRAKRRSRHEAMLESASEWFGRGGAAPTALGPWGNIVAIRRPGGGYCAPWIYVDGLRTFANPGESLADILPLERVLAVEIYRAPFEGTLNFRDISRCECGALVFWTNLAE